jgi:hypothetical protein
MNEYSYFMATVWNFEVISHTCNAYGIRVQVMSYSQCNKTTMIWITFDLATSPHAWIQHANPWVTLQFVVGLNLHTFKLSKYVINNTNSVGLKACAIEK